MSFDKAKAMRNAERFVAQGKIRSAIAEYRMVVENDPRDIATLNMLGDLYAKSAEKKDAVECYLQVADHYNAQGFSQKAIAVYNKVSRIQPDSIEVSAKLAELHKGKGSLAEARAHYATLAEHYQKGGRQLDALAMYKQIALLDPNNTDVCLNLADSYLREGQNDDAVESYAEAAARFSRQTKHEDAIRALMKGFSIRSNDLRILNGLVKAHTAMGRAGKAESLLEEILENEPYNRDVLYLMIECCIDSNNAAGAEKAVVRLVEIEPANYPRFLELIRIYLNSNDIDSAARVLTMSTEYLLAGGQSDECGNWINEVLERDPCHLSGLRLLIRYTSWLKDESGFVSALERLYAAASITESVEDERFALSQLVVVRPYETKFRERLDEINAEHGFEDVEVDEDVLRSQFVVNSNNVVGDEYVTSIATDPNDEENAFSLEHNGHAVNVQVVESESGFEISQTGTPDGLSLSDEQTIQKEIESVTFYIENDYNDLAEKALTDLTDQFGDRPEFSALRKRIGLEPALHSPAAAGVSVKGNALGIEEIRSEFGLADDVSDGDYETHYNTAVAYQEMGLTEEAIREFQEAINCTSPNDGSRRFFYCSNLLGHCFLQNGNASHAVTWFNRALETDGISDEEYHGLWYELALAYSAHGDDESAARYFEKIYAEDVDFRDVSDRVKNLVGKS
ncbi:MAG: tetratricopeptide repeat protein [Pyrinomonadaceae bacterium]